MRKFITILFLAIFFMPAYSQQADFINIEDAVVKIKEKEKELSQKEQDLNAREEKLNALEKDLVSREASLTALRSEITDKLNKLDTGNDDEMNKLAKLYSSTKPKQAAAVFIHMDVEKSAAILMRLNASAAGKIMDEIAKQDPSYASKLTLYMSNGQKVNVAN